METQPSFETNGHFYKSFFKSTTDDMQMCIQICLQCSQVCEQAVQYSLDQGGRYMEPRHIRQLQDCAEMCRVAANFMMRDSSLHMQTCRTCALVCWSTAADCERFSDDATMKMCADICRRCAESCQQMCHRSQSFEIKEV